MHVLPKMLSYRLKYASEAWKDSNTKTSRQFSRSAWLLFLIVNAGGTLFVISLLLLGNWNGYETVFNADCNCYQTIQIVVKNEPGKDASMGLNIEDMESMLLQNKAKREKQREEKNSHLFPGKKIIIFTMFRSGSSFLADMFAYQPGVYYMFEPLQTYPPPVTSKDAQELQAKADHIKNVGGRFLKQLLDCDFYPFRKDVIKFHKDGYGRISTWGRKVFCRHYEDGFFISSLCNPHRADKVENRCKNHQTVMIKTIALKNLTVLIPFLRQGVKVIHLVRDPRGQIQSIRNLPGGNTKSVPQWTSMVCSQLRKDLMVRKQIEQMPPNIKKHYKLVRYEDLSLNPRPMSERLFKFAGLEMHKKVKQWLEEATTTREDSRWSTYRMSNETAVAWRKTMKFHAVRWIQEACGDSLRKLGYANVTTLKELLDLNISLVQPIPMVQLYI